MLLLFFMCSSSTGLLSGMHNLVDFLLLKAYGLFFHYVHGKTNYKLPISSMLEIYYTTVLKSGSDQDEKLHGLGLGLGLLGVSSTSITRVNDLRQDLFSKRAELMDNIQAV